LSFQGIFRRDAASDVTKLIAFNPSTDKKMYWHKYCDYHAIKCQYITSTAHVPALVGYEVEVRDAGIGREV